MLKLKSITKTYRIGDTVVNALRGVDIEFRKSEFVAVLGPSGCGKTTLLNIIGGLDRYDSGDLSIKGVSTSRYRDGDWDTYRNHSIGFVFQSYNLIPHQSVLANVELALTLSGVSSAARKRRAKKALEQVGLSEQIHKKPNQMSGGQMQRVAIARALVNDPEILLADEPTGALDSETSIQVMDLLKEIAKDRLVIMVTHNPELAERYATRTVRLLDGQIISDSQPYSEEAERQAEKEAAQAHKAKRTKKPSVSFWTALSLSLNNLMTKKARTFLTSFAGSIGIIGIALILALSNGIQIFINAEQESALASAPITLMAETKDMSSLLGTLMGNRYNENDHENDAVYANPILYELMNSMNSAEVSTNNLVAFKEFLEKEDNGLDKYISIIQYQYDLDPAIYTKSPDGSIVQSDVQTLMSALMGEQGSSNSGTGTDTDGQTNSPFGSMMGSSNTSFSTMSVWEEMLPGRDGAYVSDLLTDPNDGQYTLVHGEWPDSYDEIILVLNDNNEISDLVLYALGLKTVDELVENIQQAHNGELIDITTESWSYEEICNQSFRWIPAASVYQYDSETGTYLDLRTTETGLSYLYDNGIDLKISGIVKPNENASSSMMVGSLGYTSALTDYVIQQAEENAMVQAQLEDPATDIFSGLPFVTDEDIEPSDAEKAAAIKVYLSELTNAEKAAIYAQIAALPSEEYLASAIEQALAGVSREDMEAMLLQAYSAETGMDAEQLQEYFAQMDDETMLSYVKTAMEHQITAQYAESVQAQLGAMTTDQLAGALDQAVAASPEGDLAAMYDEYMPATKSESTLEENLKQLGYVDKDSPAAIHIYATTFENKDAIADAITEYNKTVAEEDQISYTDYMAIIMSSVATIINAISYVLIAFVSISLIVSSIMIGIITYISVLERTKEIGVLRSLGASKRDISRVFNAETLIVGFSAGMIGILVTLLLCIPINIIIHTLTGLTTINATLPVAGGVILVVISMVLTMVAGLIPSHLAAKKDPVIALRTE